MDCLGFQSLIGIQLSIFDIDCIVDWYRNLGDEYPKIKQFFELLDYIRLLILKYIGYLNRHKSNFNSTESQNA